MSVPVRVMSMRASARGLLALRATLVRQSPLVPGARARSLYAAAGARVGASALVRMAGASRVGLAVRVVPRRMRDPAVPTMALWRAILSTSAPDQKSENEAKQAAALAAAKQNPSSGGFLSGARKWLGSLTWQSIKTATIHEAKKFWLSFKLLMVEFRIAWGIVKQLPSGQPLTRREKRQLVRTAADIVRLIPLIIVVVVPFMEFVLPFVLMLFPGILPSTFEDKDKAAEAQKKKLQGRIEIAKFLQDMNAELLADVQVEQGAAELVAQFRERVARGEPVDNAMVRKIAALFGDRLTIQNLSREQLLNLCKYMGIMTYGTTAFLRARLARELETLRQDDIAINSEGIDNLTEDELRAACVARGMRGHGIPVDRLRSQLASWLELHLLDNVPASLLILSRAMLLANKVSPMVQLKATLAALPEEIVEQVRAGDGSAGGMTDAALIAERAKLAQVALTQSATDKQAQQSAALEQSKLEALKDTVLTLTSDSAVVVQKEDLIELKAAKSATAGSAASATVAPDSSTAKAAKVLESRVDTMLAKLEVDLAELEKKMAGRAKEFDLNKDGRLSADELRKAAAAMSKPLSDEQLKDLMRRIDRDHDGIITTQELTEHIERLTKVADAK